MAKAFFNMKLSTRYAIYACIALLGWIQPICDWMKGVL